ncbi:MULTISPECIES: transglutaminase family protein [unclassified Novosphingobium]|uniref:transglutaminase family protein n=1 Tax=unclassified Novosphingobium TaxID=2644732 RepID=UPI00020EE94A|nr:MULTISPECIES: transglutaminase family protein [unclassified Novosphingobium]GFM28511.1 transglutaminase [Novosphingobium sp. PY1]CCA91665.1 transglutaminase domain-containing protein [Novosphingobium sp. PP1Y]
MRYSVSHITTLDYAAPVSLAQFNVRLRPAAWPGQAVGDFTLSVDPQPAQIVDSDGGYYINESRFTLRQPIRHLQIESRFTVEKESLPFFVTGAPGPDLAEIRETAMKLPDLSPLGPASYIYASPIAAPERDIALWASGFLTETMPVMEAGRMLMDTIHQQFAYDAKATATDTPPIEAFNNRHGVCQDFSHIMIIAARAHGIPAAYVSGYLRTIPPPGQARLVGADAMHAWVNLWCGEDLGWVGFDPTNAMLADTDHIFIGMGRDYGDVAPLDGTFRGGAQQSMHFSVDVAPLD